MSTAKPTTPAARRHRRMQDDLLADLRQAAPMPVARPEDDRPAPVPSERPDPAERPAERPDPAGSGTPAVEVRLTPLRWSAPSMRPVGTRTGLVLTIGPVRISITGFGR